MNTTRTTKQFNPPLADTVGGASVDAGGGVSLFSALDADALNTELDGRLVDAGFWLSVLPEAIDAIVDGLFERGDKVAVFGKSKTRKSFFVLQLAFSMAMGCNFLGLAIGKRRRVLLIQLEIKANHQHRRTRNMAYAMQVQHIDGFHVLNGRGLVITKEMIIRLARQIGADVTIIDPIYKLNTGDESAEPLAAIMAMFDAITEATGATVIYVHHDKKGASGDLDLVDRGSGSGIVGRDYDAAFFLTPHADGGNVVVEFITRNHPPMDGIVARFEEGCFVQDESAVAQVETSATQRNRRAKGATLAQLADQAGEMLDVGDEMQVEAFRRKVQDQFTVGQHKARDIINTLTERDGFTTERTKGFPSKVIVRRTS